MGKYRPIWDIDIEWVGGGYGMPAGSAGKELAEQQSSGQRRIQFIGPSTTNGYLSNSVKQRTGILLSSSETGKITCICAAHVRFILQIVF